MSTRTNRIVVGVDGSPASLHALRYAVERLSTVRTCVQAVYVYDSSGPLLFANAGYPLTTAVDPELVRASAEAALREYAAAALGPRGDHRVELLALTGVPAYVALTRQAAGATMLVVGAHRGHGIFERLLGSTAQSCVRHAPCPVLVVPPPRDEAAAPAREAALVCS